MARRNRIVSVPVVGRAPRRLTAWSDIAAGASSGVAGGVLLNSGNAALLAFRPFTIVRTHLEVLIFSDQVAAQESQLGAIAGAVVSDEAVAIGVTAVPTPTTNANSDLFFFHQWLMNQFEFASGTGWQADAGTRYTIDSRAMRKVNDDQDVIIVSEMNGTASNGFTLLTAGRMLIKLH